jgi:AraC-like DNA-binding protein
MTNRLHLYQNAYINPILQYFDDSGVNMGKLKRQSNLSNYDLTNLNAWTPAELTEGFLKRIFWNQGVSHLDSSFNPYLELSMIGEFGEYLASLNTILEMLNACVKYEPTIFTVCRSQVKIEGAKANFTWKFHNRLTQGRQTSEELNFRLNLFNLTSLIGEYFEIFEIKIPSYNYEKLKHSLPSGNYKLTQTKDTYAIIFPSQLLAVKNPLQNDSQDAGPPLDTPTSTESKVRFLIRDVKEGTRPKLSDFAKEFNISERTLARKLNDEGVNFLEILNENHCAKSITYLQDPSLSLKFISQILGYQEVSNFIRAFKHWTGVSPHEFRKSL